MNILIKLMSIVSLVIAPTLKTMFHPAPQVGTTKAVEQQLVHKTEAVPAANGMEHLR